MKFSDTSEVRSMNVLKGILWHQFCFEITIEPEETSPPKKPKLAKCVVCTDFANLPAFDNFLKKSVKLHIECLSTSIHENGQIQCKICETGITIPQEKPAEEFSPSIFLCSSCSDQNGNEIISNQMQRIPQNNHERIPNNENERIMNDF